MVIIVFTAVIVNLGVVEQIKNSFLHDFSPMDNISPWASIINKLLPTPTQRVEPQPTPSPSQPLTPTSTTDNPSVRVYNDFSYELTDIDWGTINIAVGESKIYTINVVNNGNRPVVLSLSTVNWTPGISGTVTWNYDGKALAVNAAVPITLTLTIQSANVTAFSNSIIIRAS
jgi:hypothetical protein